tara:strand:- start:321 stop:560 length:240 start_codon:yes stop_codon:yes gene_type:complete
MKTIKQPVICAANPCHIVDEKLPPSTLGGLKEIFYRFKFMFFNILFYLARLLLISPVKGQSLGISRIWQMINSDRRMLL